MNGPIKLLLLAIVVTLMSANDALGQRRTFRPGYYIDRVIQNSINDIVRQYHYDWLPNDSTYIVPQLDGTTSGTYYFRNGGYYYVPHSNADFHEHSPAPVAFGGFSHVGDLAKRLDTLANELCLDLHYNYAHNPGFREAYREAYSLLQTTNYIREAEQQNDRKAIQKVLAGVHSMFHHIQDDVRGWSRHQRKQIGQRGISSKMAVFESTLHHLMNDVGVEKPGLRTHEVGVEQAPPPE